MPSPLASSLPFGTGREPLEPAQIERVLTTAQWLRQAENAFQRQSLLRGKDLALICDSFEDPDALRIREAAARLGARIAHTRISLRDLRTPAIFRQTARMLGRLYHGIACQGVPADLARDLGLEAGVPVFRDLASPEHPLARLALRIQDGESFEKRHRLVVQAALMCVLA